MWWWGGPASITVGGHGGLGGLEHGAQGRGAVAIVEAEDVGATVTLRVAATRPPRSRPRSVASTAKGVAELLATAAEVLIEIVATAAKFVAEVAAMTANVLTEFVATAAEAVTNVLATTTKVLAEVVATAAEGVAEVVA